MQDSINSGCFHCTVCKFWVIYNRSKKTWVRSINTQIEEKFFIKNELDKKIYIQQTHDLKFIYHKFLFPWRKKNKKLLLPSFSYNYSLSFASLLVRRSLQYSTKNSPKFVKGLQWIRHALLKQKTTVSVKDAVHKQTK